MADEVFVSTPLDERTAKKFDKIAADNFRSRAQHLKYIIEKEIEFHEQREKEGKR